EVIKNLQGAGLTQIQYTGFTRRSATAMTVFTGNAKSLNDQLEFMQNVLGLTEEATNKMLDTGFRRWGSFIQLMEYLKVVMGEQIMKSLSDITGRIMEMKGPLESLAKSFGNIVAWIIKAAAWKPVFTMVTLSIIVLVPLVHGIGSAFAHMANSLRLAFAATTKQTFAQMAHTESLIVDTLAMGNWTTLNTQRIASTNAVTIALGRQTVATKTAASAIGGPLVLAIVAVSAALYIMNKTAEVAKKRWAELKQEIMAFQSYVESVEGKPLADKITGTELYIKELKEQLNKQQAALAEGLTWGEKLSAPVYETATMSGAVKTYLDYVEKITNQKRVAVQATKAHIAVLEQETIKLKEQQKLAPKGIIPIDPTMDMEGWKFRNKKLIEDIQDEKDKAITDSFNREMAQMLTKYNQEKELVVIQGEDINALNNKYQWKEYNLKMKYWQKEEEERIKMEERMAEERERINKDSLTSIGELVIRLTKAGLEEQLLVIEYERQEALRKAAEIGANLDWINLQFDLLMQRAAQDQLGSTKGGGLDALTYSAAGLMTQTAGRRDPTQILHKDNEQSKKLLVDQLKVSKEHKDAFNKFLDFLGGNPLLISTLEGFGN
ncbi:MAG: hypothetical protein KKB31_06885, partial [Nanoarchaeota archaeon]|nr:hypothetical protein [Nanoarchaeota archaeon]